MCPFLWNDANGGTTSGAVGGTAALRLNIRDKGSFYLRWDMLPIAAESSAISFDPGGTQHALSVGLGAGSVPALKTTGAAVLIVAVLVALGFGSGS